MRSRRAMSRLHKQCEGKTSQTALPRRRPQSHSQPVCPRHPCTCTCLACVCTAPRVVSQLPLRPCWLYSFENPGGKLPGGLSPTGLHRAHARVPHGATLPQGRPLLRVHTQRRIAACQTCPLPTTRPPLGGLRTHRCLLWTTTPGKCPSRRARRAWWVPAACCAVVRRSTPLPRVSLLTCRLPALWDVWVTVPDVQRCSRVARRVVRPPLGRPLSRLPHPPTLSCCHSATCAFARTTLCWWWRIWGCLPRCGPSWTKRPLSWSAPRRRPRARPLRCPAASCFRSAPMARCWRSWFARAPRCAGAESGGRGRGRRNGWGVGVGGVLLRRRRAVWSLRPK